MGSLARNLQTVRCLFKISVLMRRILGSMALATLLLAAAPARSDELGDLALQVRRESALVERMAAAHSSSRRCWRRMVVARLALVITSEIKR